MPTILDMVLRARGASNSLLSPFAQNPNVTSRLDPLVIPPLPSLRSQVTDEVERFGIIEDILERESQRQAPTLPPVDPTAPITSPAPRRDLSPLEELNAQATKWRSPSPYSEAASPIVKQMMEVLGEAPPQLSAPVKGLQRLPQALDQAGVILTLPVAKKIQGVIDDLAQRGALTKATDFIIEFMRQKYPKFSSLPGEIRTPETAFMDIFGSIGGSYNAKNDYMNLYNRWNYNKPEDLADSFIHEAGHAYQAKKQLPKLEKDPKSGRSTKELLMPADGGTYKQSDAYDVTGLDPNDPTDAAIIAERKAAAFKAYQDQQVEVDARRAGATGAKAWQKFLDILAPPLKLFDSHNEELPPDLLKIVKEAERKKRRALHSYWSDEDFDKYIHTRNPTNVDVRLGLATPEDPVNSVIREWLKAQGYEGYLAYGERRDLAGEPIKGASQLERVFPNWPKPERLP